MRLITTFEEAHAALRPYAQELPAAAEAYNLSRMVRLMEFLGNPQDTLKIIHVAGTSGKTSTSYYAASLLQLSGQKVGLTISPHLDEINERLQVNLKPLPEMEYGRVLSEFLDIIQSCAVRPTYFELMIAMAYWYFHKEKVDYAVIEVGVGGLLDSTNVCTRQDKVCVITDIGLDHQHLLGGSLTEIARQKAGIIKPYNEVYCYKQSHEVDEVFAQTCANVTARLHERVYAKPAFNPVGMPNFQQRNWQLAAHAFEGIRTRDNLPELSSEEWTQSQQTYIPGRMEIICFRGKTLIMDGAHNPQKIHTLVDSLVGMWPGKQFGAMVAFKSTKDSAACISELEPLVAHVICTGIKSVKDHGFRGAAASEIAIGVSAPVIIEPDSKIALEKLLELPYDTLLITGSIYLLSEIRKLIKT